MPIGAIAGIVTGVLTGFEGWLNANLQRKWVRRKSVNYVP